MTFDFICITSFFWAVRTIKLVLFWIYLWQLKEYHIGRFRDHFTTDKGKKLIFNPLFAVKIVLLPLIFLQNVFIYILLLVYIAEFLFFALHIIKRNFVKPVLTPKTALLIFISIIAAGLFLFKAYQVSSMTQFAASLMLFDIFTPIIISVIVVLIQPLFVFGRMIILKKATKKMATFKNLKVIGITGSYGKTSTKEFLTTILSSKFNVVSTPEHKNSEIGIAQTILSDLQPNHEIFIVEMGSYNKGGIKLLCDIVKPSIGIVTGVNQQHLATFGSMENLLSAEGGEELVVSLPKDGLIIVNGDNKYCLDVYKKKSGRKKIYTLKKDVIDSDIWTEDVLVSKDSLSFIAVSSQKEMAHFNVSVLGKQQVQNLLGAILVATEFGMSFEEISEACKKITQAQGGMTLKKGIHGIHIIDSSYSSNPDGVMADLDYLSVFNGKKIIVMPCLIELGEKSAEIHKKIGKKIAQVCDLAIITTKDKFEEIKSGFLSSDKKPQIIFSDNPKEIFDYITTFCKEGDTVLLEGRVPGELIRLLIDE